MGVADARAQLNPKIEADSDWKAPQSVQESTQTHTFDALHSDEWATLFKSKVVAVDQIRVPKKAHDPSFPKKVFPVTGVINTLLLPNDL